MKFKLKCKSLSDKICVIVVTDADSIDNIKRKLSEKVNIKHENIGLLYKNQFLFIDKLLSDYQIGNENEIVVYFEYENCARYSISDSVNERLRELNIDKIGCKFIRVYIKECSGKAHGFNLPQRSKVAHLKQLIANKLNIDIIDNLALTFDGDHLDDERTLDSYYIDDHMSILLVTKLASGSFFIDNLSILSIIHGYDKLELTNVRRIDQIFDAINSKYNIDKTNIRLYNKVDEQIIDIYNVRSSTGCVYYWIESGIREYDIVTKLGDGSFGTAFKCKEEISNKTYALKHFKIFIDGDWKINFEKQLARFLSLEKHPRIIELIKYIDHKDSSYLLMEYIDQGNLPETKSAKYAQQILEGLEHLHIHRIIHGNINGENILIDKFDNVKLCDFGLRTIFNNISNRNRFNGVEQSEIGAINWLSPEIIRGDKLVPASDIWSFGAVMVEMVTGRIPHFGLTVGQIVFAIMKGEIRFICPAMYKDHIKSFVNICLQAKPGERANFDDLYEHSFLKQT